MNNEHDIIGNSDEWARLIASEIRYRRLFEAAHDGILIVDPDTRKITDANPFMAELLSYSRNELVGKELWEIGLLRDEAESKEAFRTLQETGSIRYEDLPLKSKDGQAHDVEFVSNVYQEGERNVIQCNIRDITERKRAADAARTAEDRFRLMVDSVKDYAIFSTDEKGLIDSWNTGAERVFGYLESEIIGLPIATIYTSGDRASGRPEYEMKTAAEKGRAEDEQWHLRKDGCRIFVSGTVTPIRDEARHIKGFTKIARDITERKEADSRKDEFLAMLAHELRNPLSSIGTAITLLQMPNATAEHVDWSKEVIDRQVKHLARILDDLTDVSRLSRGTFEIHKDRIDASVVINCAVDTVRPQIEAKQQQLIVSFTPGTLWCEADPTRLEQALTNLLVNATRYTEAGGHIWLSAGHDDGHIAFRVRDTGIGILPAKLPEMFELFAQGDRTNARSEGGLGVGLTLIKHIAELHGGSIAAFSEGPRKGSEFTLKLPAIAQPIPATAITGVADPARNRRSSILIVDDNLDTARGLTRLLKLLGHEIHTAHDGPVAIREALAFRPQFVLLDIGLPGMDGYEVAKRMRAEGLQTTVIIAISGYGQEEDRRRSSEAGIDFHLVKPIDFNALVSLIAQPT
jgi:PAS domain S-box-containing protein